MFVLCSFCWVVTASYGVVFFVVDFFISVLVVVVIMVGFVGVGLVVY